MQKKYNTSDHWPIYQEWYQIKYKHKNALTPKAHFFFQVDTAD